MNTKLNLQDHEKKANNKLKGIILAIIGAFMWGIMGVFVRGLSASGYTSYDIAFVRCALAGIAFFIFKLITNPEVLKIDIKGLLVCLFYGVSAYSIGFVAYGVAVDRIPVAVATVLMFMSPIWVALLGTLVFKEKLSKRTAIIILVCILGAAMVSNIFSATGSMDIIGVIAGLINGFGVALQIMIPRYFEKQYSRDTMLVYGFLGSALALSFLTDFNTIASTFIINTTPNIWLNVFGVSILCTMVANVSFVKSTEFINTTTSSILSALEVVVGALVGFMIFNENMTAVQIVGAIIVVVASLQGAIEKKEQGD